VAFSLLVILGFALFVAPFACPWPDGLESVATKLGIKPDSMQSHVPAPAPDYAMPGIEWPVGATALAGVIGALVVFGMAWWLGRILVRRTDPQPSTPSLSQRTPSPGLAATLSPADGGGEGKGEGAAPKRSRVQSANRFRKFSS